MKPLWLSLLVIAGIAATQGCSCGGATPSEDGGSSGGGPTGGGATGGGGPTGGGTGGATGGGTGGGAGGSAGAVRPAKDVISGAGRLTGGNFIMNAQVGQGVPQAPATGGGRVIEGNTAINR